LICMLFIIYDRGVYYRRLFKLIIPTIFYMHTDTLVLYLLTPRELTYKSSNILIMAMLSITYVMRFLMFPSVFLFDETVFIIIKISVQLFRLYFILCVTKVYCPPNFKKCYILILIELANAILRIHNSF